MKWVLTIHRFECDGCGEVEDDEVDEPPEGWTEEGDEHHCSNCA